MRRIVLAVLLGCGLAACSADPLGGIHDASPESLEPTLQATLGDTIHLGPGEIAEVGPEGLRILFEEVLDDSRCPRGVTCVWAGDATVHLGLALRESVWTPAELHTDEEPKEWAHGGHVVELVRLEPHPVDGSSIRAEEYVAVLRVTPG